MTSAAGPRDCYHLGLIGYPLGHSRSPQLHHAALRAFALAGEYCLFAIPPDENGSAQVAGMLEQLRAGVLHGLNVTIPHKQTVIPFVDRLSLVSRAVGAVNTLYLDESGQLTGDNTDVPGFLYDVRRLTGAAAGDALVLGSGGSARAVVYALGQAGWQVTVLARREEQAVELVRSVGFGRAGDLSRDRLASTQCDLLVNTTPLGMTPQVDGCPWPEDIPLPHDAAVYDLVYNPLETVLTRRARAEGHPALNGAGMLTAQAALAFQIWTGLEAPFAVMDRAFYEQGESA